MNWRTEWQPLVTLAGVLALCYFLPVDSARLQQAVIEALALTRWYAREHVILCLLPAFFIAGGIAVFVQQGAVLRYLGADAPKALAYGVAAISGTILAVCSCTVLPLFAGIYRMGAGLGPATAFLYSGPAVNVLALVLTAAVLGPRLGLARAVGAIGFSIVIGLLMHFIYAREEKARAAQAAQQPVTEPTRPLWQNALYFAAMVGILVFANWGAPQSDTGLWAAIHAARWWLTAACAVALAVMLARWFGLPVWQLAGVGVVTGLVALLIPQQPQAPFLAGVLGLSLLTAPRRDEAGEWFAQSWGYAKLILPLLLAGVLIAGLLLGRPGAEGLIPAQWVHNAVGGNSLRANFVAALAGAFMYFATLTEVPILQGLLGSGMGEGPALALLLAGPAVSLPNMLVIRSVLGTQKTLVFVSLVVIMATLSGMIYGTFVPA